MKVVFVGPSLSESALSQFRHRIDFRPPAEFGDIARAVLEGAGTIGLVDGLFEDRASVWHKEILFALSEGVHVFGAASMGALRAAECHRFGMVGVGEVFNRFVSGDLIDDDAVTQVHAPPELQYLPLSEPLVNIDATCSRLLVLALITASEAQAVSDAARVLFFKERTIPMSIDGAFGLANGRRGELHRLFRQYRRDVKAEDAQALLRAVYEAPGDRSNAPQNWRFAETNVWKRLLTQINLDISERVAAHTDASKGA